MSKTKSIRMILAILCIFALSMPYVSTTVMAADELLPDSADSTEVVDTLVGAMDSDTQTTSLRAIDARTGGIYWVGNGRTIEKFVEERNRRHK